MDYETRKKAIMEHFREMSFSEKDKIITVLITEMMTVTSSERTD